MDKGGPCQRDGIYVAHPDSKRSSGKRSPQSEVYNDRNISFLIVENLNHDAFRQLPIISVSEHQSWFIPCLYFAIGNVQNLLNVSASQVGSLLKADLSTLDCHKKSPRFFFVFSAVCWANYSRLC